jgi:hypothetical protein
MSSWLVGTAASDLILCGLCLFAVGSVAYVAMAIVGDVSEKED